MTDTSTPFEDKNEKSKTFCYSMTIEFADRQITSGCVWTPCTFILFVLHMQTERSLILFGDHGFSSFRDYTFFFPSNG